MQHYFLVGRLGSPAGLHEGPLSPLRPFDELRTQGIRAGEKSASIARIADEQSHDRSLLRLHQAKVQGGISWSVFETKTTTHRSSIN